MTKEAAIAFMLEAANYFELRPTDGEDSVHWSNVYNAQNCRKIADMLKGSRVTPMEFQL